MLISFLTKSFSSQTKGKSRDYIRADTEQVYAPHKERLFKLENGYYLLFYHRQKWYTMFLLYLRFLVPIVILCYLIRENPFYTSYPVMLPFFVTILGVFFYRTVKYSRKTNHMVHQILMDPTGTELTFVYKNQMYRKLRADDLERTLMISNLVNPPQGEDFRTLLGDTFPETYPFPYGRIYDFRYFWLKYYVSQRNLFAIPKKPTYVNYEVLCNAFATKIIDMSKAEIYLLKSSEMNKTDFEDFLYN